MGRPEQKVQPNPELEAAILDFVDDPLGFVRFAYPWGEPGTFLEHEEGPDVWQEELLVEIGRQIKERAFNGHDPVKPIRIAIASGHGIGKSTITCWIIHHVMSTRPFSKGTITANTGGQLRDKTWAQLSKWHSVLINKDWFGHMNSPGNMSYKSVENPDSWGCTAFTCRKENTESFAGQHAADATSLYIFDEASKIPNEIYEVANGGLTDGEPMIFLFGNPTRGSGAFFDCFNRQSHRWTTRQIDSRTAKKTNKAEMQEWIDDYGEDSDFVRVRVRGMFPRSGSLQFISSEAVREAMERKLHASEYDYAPKVMGVDVARFGDDMSVICKRQGLAVHTLKKYRGLDTMQMAHQVAEEIKTWEPDMVFVDVVGVGAGVVDCLRTELGYKQVRGVNAGSRASTPAYFNLRAEMWGKMRDALMSGMSLPDDNEFEADLTGLEYGYTCKEALKLEKKEDAKRRGIRSPDTADALALSYAYPVHRKSDLERAEAAMKKQQAMGEYDIFSETNPWKESKAQLTYDPFEVNV